MIIACCRILYILASFLLLNPLAFLVGLGVNGYSSGYKNYEQFRARPGGIVVFNHSTCFDHAILMDALSGPCRFLVKSLHVCTFPFNIMCWFFRCIYVEVTGTTAILKREVDARRPGEAPIAVAPDAGLSGLEQDELPEFKTGAFHASHRVLPVVIKYDPYQPWKSSVPIARYCFDRITGPSMRYHCQILPEITRGTDESVEAFAERTRTAMQSSLRSMKVDPHSRKASCLLAMTSILFFVCAVKTYCAGSFTPAIGMLSVGITSMWYHTTYSLEAYTVDTVMNFLLGGMFFWMSPVPVRAFAIIACLGHCITQKKNDLAHAFLVHLPVIAGFWIYV